MKTNHTLSIQAAGLVALWLLGSQLSAWSQGTAFTYQGRMTDSGGSPVNGTHDLQLRVYSASTGGSPLNSVTLPGVAISNGLFTVLADFGAGVFNGDARWLEIADQTTLAVFARQQVTATPYAITAGNITGALAASQISGSIPMSQVSGIVPLAQLPAAVITNNEGGVNLVGTFAGNGAGVTNVAISSLNTFGVIAWGNCVSNSSPLTGIGPRTVIAADVKGLGKLDLISANSLTNTLTLLSNNGKGGFGTPVTLKVGNAPYCVAAADVNGDSKVDLISANFSDGTLTVLTNNGSGGFGSNATLSVAASPVWVVAVDVNGDNKVDLISANSGNSTLTVLTNDGSGNFGFNATLAAGGVPHSLAAADVNGDGRMDLISANTVGNSGNLTVLTNSGSGFVIKVTIGLGVATVPQSVTAADVNGDGKLDLISANYGAGTLTVLTNNGSGTFATYAAPHVGTGPYSVVAADVNGDGKLDLICANAADNTLTLLTNNGSGFGAQATIHVGSSPESVTAADVNGDGPVDLICANYGDNTLTVLLNTPTFTGAFNGSASGSFTGAASGSFAGNASGSFTGDGGGLTNLNASQLTSGTLAPAQLPSAAVTNYEVSVNLGGVFGRPVRWGYFALASSPAAGNVPIAVTAADVNGDGKMDLISTSIANVNDGTGTLRVMTNNGSGGFVLASTIAVGAYPNAVIATNINGDGKIDIVCMNTGEGTLSVLTNDGNGGFVLSSAPSVGNTPRGIVAADVNGDGKADLIAADLYGVGLSYGTTLTVLTNDGSGGFVLASSPTVGSGPIAVTAADVNGDGKMDLISVNFNANTLTVLTNNGSGGFVLASSPPVGFQPRSVVAADINGDGKMDLMCAGDDNLVTVLTNSGNGSFGLASTPATGSAPQQIVAADVNADGKMDLITVNQGDNTLTVLTNDGSGGFVLASSPAVGLAPRAVVAADVNGDGRVDLISANQNDGTLTVLFNTQGLSTFAGDGSGLISLNAANITAGTLADAQLSTNVALLNANQTFSGINTFSNAANSFTGTFSGNGSGLSNVTGATGGNYVFAYDNSVQAVVTPNVIQDITFATDARMAGWTHTSGTAPYTCTQSGLYLVQYTGQASITSSTLTSVSMRALSGSLINGSTAAVVLTVSGQASDICRSFIASFTAGDTLTLQMTASTSSGQLGVSTSLLRPSVSMTIIRIQ